MGYKWSEESTMKFVSEYIKHRCIWDKRHSDNKNQKVRRYIYRKLAEAMRIQGFNCEDVPSKIKNIRSTYFQELKKIKNAKDSNTVYFITLKWFTKLDSAFKSANQADAGNSEDDMDTNQHILNPNEIETGEDMLNQLNNDDFFYLIENELKKPNIEDKLNTIGGYMSNILPDQYDYTVDYWRLSLKSLPDLQLAYALKLIEQALFEGELGNLNHKTRLICYDQSK